MKRLWNDRGHAGGADVLWTIFLILAIVALVVFLF